ncbi:MAG TPA: hypothetical protein VGR35_05245 [Tepidisphaeraceae bacterium]|nr:hypothetical protein [Tepidisphaeraceae bacterium]
MDRVRSIRLLSTLALMSLAASAVRGSDYELVKVGNGAGNGRITFRGTSQPNGPHHLTVAANPVINGKNLYAPDLLRVGDGWNNYFGGWMSDSDVNDRIYLGTRPDREVNGDWEQKLAISNGVYIHVHDPSVVRHDSQWHMVYTAARNVGERFTDWINYSSSTNGINWTPAAGTVSTQLVMTDPLGVAGGAISDIARPSLVKTDTGWKMWFDARVEGGAPHSYLAHSAGPAPTQFQLVRKYDDAAGFPGFFEPDIVRRPDGTYAGVIQRGFATLHLVSSTDGVNFTVGKPVVNVADPFFTREKVSNPGLVYDQLSDEILGIGFGMTDSPDLVGHDIGFTHPHLQVQVRSPDGVWHVFAQANAMDEQFVHVFNYTRFDQVRVTDPSSGKVVLQREFNEAQVGDIWRLQAIPEPSALAPVISGALLLLKRSPATQPPAPRPE